MAIAVVRVPGDPATHPAIAAHWLSGDEHARNRRFKVDHARCDFLAGRVAAKSALQALVADSAPPSAWAVRPGAQQRPEVRHVFPGRAVTLAHAGGVGLAIAGDERWFCGVDLEPTTRDAGDVIVSQVSTAEAAWAREGGDEERLRWLLLWTAREALGKGLGTGLLEPDALRAAIDWRPVAHGWAARFAGEGRNVVRAVVAGGFVAAMALRDCVPDDPHATVVATWLAESLGALH